MAYVAPAPSDSYSDTDDESEYGFDLTAEEEDLLDSLIARASEEPEAQPTQQSGKLRRPQRATPSTSDRGSATRRAPNTTFATPPPLASSFQERRQPVATPTVGTSLQKDIAAAFASHASVKSLNESELNFNARQALKGTGSTYRHDTEALSNLIGTRGRVPLPVEDTDDQHTVRANAESGARGFTHDPAGAGDISYPDLSHALKSVHSPPATTATIDYRNNTKAEESDDEYGFKDVESPLSRFRSFPKKPFSVSDLIAGAWCELQYYYTLTKLPGGKKTRTAAMKGGSKLHQGLEDEIYTTVKVEIVKKEDAFGLRLWNIIQGLRTLRETGMTRELEVWGLVEGHVVNGVIDHLNYENPDPEFEEEIRSSQGSQEKEVAAQGTPGQGQQKITTFFHSSAKPDHDQIYLTDVKTTAASRPPSGAAVRPAKIQLFLYHRFLSDMAAGRLDFLRVVTRYGLNPDEPFSDTFVAQIGSLHEEMFEFVSDMATSGSNKDSISDYKSAMSSPGRGSGSGSGSSAASDLIRYRTPRELLSLLQHELQVTFPHGAESLGSLVTVEYRKRPRRSPSGGHEEVEDDEDGGGKIVGANVFFVDHNVLQDYLRQDLEWWEGERDPKGVDIEEAGFKCRSCEFANECEWREQQDAEMLSRARTRIASRGKRQSVK